MLHLWPHSQTNQAQGKISVLLSEGELDHYIVEAPLLAPCIEVDGEFYLRTEDIAHVRIKDKYGKRLETYRVYRRGNP